MTTRRKNGSRTSHEDREKEETLQTAVQLGREYRRLLKKYPDNDPLRRGWRALALGIAIAALAEEYFGVDSWEQILGKRRRKQ